MINSTIPLGQVFNEPFEALSSKHMSVKTDYRCSHDRCSSERRDPFGVYGVVLESDELQICLTEIVALEKQRFARLLS